MPPRFPPLVFLFLVNLTVALAQYCSWMAYSSRDASGLQYFLLFFAGFFAVLALLVLAVERAHAPRVYVLLAGSALAVACLPNWTGPWYNWEVLDETGALVATSLLWFQASVLSHDLWRRARVVDWSELGSRGFPPLRARHTPDARSALRD